MLALMIPILNLILGGIIKPFVAAWTDYERTKLTTGEAGFAAAAAADWPSCRRLSRRTCN